MKVSVNTKEKEFQPIELNLTIESKRELEFLLTLFNSRNTDLLNLVNSSNDYPFSNFTDIPNECKHSVWIELNECYQKTNLK